MMVVNGSVVPFDNHASCAKHDVGSGRARLGSAVFEAVGERGVCVGDPVLVFSETRVWIVLRFKVGFPVPNEILMVGCSSKNGALEIPFEIGGRYGMRRPYMLGFILSKCRKVPTPIEDE